MDWISEIEKRKFLVVGGVLLISLFALAVTSLRGPVGYDPFWHLQMGKDWIENGLNPWVDHYSFTYNGHSLGAPIIFQGLLHLVVSQFDMISGFKVFKFVCFFMTMGAAILLLRQMKTPAIIYAIVVPIIVFLLQIRAMVRPELISYTLSVIALMLYVRSDYKISARNMIPISILMLVWVNYHSPILGYVIFFGFFLDCAVAQYDSRAPASTWVKWLAWGILIVAVGFLNRSFSHPLFGAVNFAPEWKSIINEYLPSASYFKKYPGMYALMLFALVTPVLAYRQRRFGMLVIWVVLVYSAISMRRMVTPGGIIISLLTVHLLTQSSFPHQLNLARKKTWSTLIGVVLLISIGLALYSDVERARYHMRENRVFLNRYPVAMADYMSEKGISGRIFNSYEIGGYLIYRLSPQNQVYIDGRTGILYPLEHYKKYEEVFKTRSPEVLRAELDEYAVDHIVWKHSQGRHDLVYEMGGFGLDFLGARYVLYTRGTSNFPLLGKLMAQPQCWRPDMLDILNVERRKMDDVLPGYSGLFPFADVVVGYSNSVDGKAYIDAKFDGSRWFDEMRRFASFRFLETGYFDLAVNVFGGVQIKKPKDYLAAAFAMIKAGRYDVVSRILEEFSDTQWPRLQTEDLYIQYKLYQLLESQKGLMSSEQKQFYALKAQLKDLKHPDLDLNSALDVESFCTLSGDEQ